MPKVSQAHLDARRRQILDAARTRFVRDGFHRTSMQDVIGEAGLSAGAIYRYFDSKEAIVVAIATETLAEVNEAFVAAARSEPPLPLSEVMARAVERLERLDEESGIARLAVQVWAEELHSPALAARIAAAVDEIDDVLTAVVARHQAHGSIDPAVSARAVAVLLRSLLPGFLVQRAVGDVAAADFRAGLAALLAPHTG